MKMSSWVFKNAAGYHPGQVTPSATDGAPLTHDYESHGFKSCRYKFFFMIPCFSNLLGELGSIRHKHWFRWQHLSPMKGHIHDKCCHLQVDGAALEEENNSPSWASESRSGLLNLRFSINYHFVRVHQPNLTLYKNLVIVLLSQLYYKAPKTWICLQWTFYKRIVAFIGIRTRDILRWSNWVSACCLASWFYLTRATAATSP